MESTLIAAMEYLDRGWSIIPCSPSTKRPCIDTWKEFQTRQPTVEEVEKWLRLRPDAHLALVTGAISGIVVVDCDNEESKRFAADHDLTSPIRVETRRGVHYYFRDPLDGGRRPPRVGSNAGKNWYHCDGLDFRGDGGYVIIPPSKNYEFHIPTGLDFDDDMPLWIDPDFSQPEVDAESDFDFGTLDLTYAGTNTPALSRIQEKADSYPNSLIPTGGTGRHDLVFNYACEACLKYGIGDELETAIRDMMDKYFFEPLDEARIRTNLQSVRDLERSNHPERFDFNGKYIAHLSSSIEPISLAAPLDKDEAVHYVPITEDDAESLIKEAEGYEYLVDPWLRKESITQVYGYSGHGKSMFLTHMMYHLACGKSMGCFEVSKPSKVLYLDFENGKATIGSMLQTFKDSFGSSHGNYNLWTPFVGKKESIDMRTPEGVHEFTKWLISVKPDVVVIDTIRTAFAGLVENKAEEWAHINKIALAIRNKGMAIVMVHHANKPSDSGTGKEAGSTNQLTVLETQIKVTQVFDDKATAEMNSGIFAGDIESNPYSTLESQMNSRGASVDVVMEVRFGKVREWTDNHQRNQYIAFGTSNTDDKRHVITSRSPKQRVQAMYSPARGHDELYLSRTLHVPVKTIYKWLEEMK
jgi:hypothetical protein|tara:strand:- start:841 stop:2757 length:1917 start_codon:yes stop_codon:yes gene_type:complete